MSLRNFMHQKSLITCKPTDTVLDLAEMMKEHDIGAVLISDGRKPLGIVTDRDIVLRCVVADKDCEETTAEDIMSEPVRTVPDTASILDLIETMREHGTRRICVVDDEGEPQGIVSMSDVFELLAHEMSQLSTLSTAHREKLFRRSRETREVA